MRDFLDDDTPLWERLGYASEADYHEAQARRAREAKEQQGREAAQRHAAAGRDYGIMKRVNRRLKDRKRSHTRWQNATVDYRERAYATRRAWYKRNRERVLQQQSCYYQQHRKEILAQQRIAYAHRRSDDELRERENAKKRAYRAAHRDKISAENRKYYARKKSDPSFVETRRTRDLERYYAMSKDPNWREKYNARMRDYRARKRAEKLAAQQQDEQQAS